MSTATIETQDLSKIYRDAFWRPTMALAGVSLRVERGVIFGLLGQNGAGKTTLVKLLLSVVRPSGGKARVLGLDPNDAHTRRRIGYLPEQMRLPEYLKAESFLRYMGKLNGLSRRALAERIPRLLELVDLSDNRKLIRAYSKGMQQRLGIAQALLNEPEVLFLDEPTEGLDPIGRKQVRDLLLALRAGGTTIFLNSHLLSEIELVCDRVVILRAGRVAGEGAPTDFVRPTGEYRIRLAAVDDAVRTAAGSVMQAVRWDGNSAYVMPAGRAQLNALIDRLRAVPVEIETIEEVRSTLEEGFIQVTAGGAS